ncbi:ParB N-terminal domain-containing protein [Rhodococcus hoagii]|nr:ParB N-terminal domain-containing protein [Prescottella equi]
MTDFPISDLVGYPGNARKGDVDLIAESLHKLGQYRPIVVNRGGKTTSGTENVVLAGNHTLQAAKKLGWSTVDVHFVDVDDDTAARIVLVDNRSNDKAAYDNQALADLLQGLPDLDATGFTDDDLTKILDSLDDVEDLPDEGDADTDDDPAAYGVIVECRSEAQQTDLLQRFMDEGLTVRALM